MKIFCRYIILILLLIKPGFILSQAGDSNLSYVFAKKLYDDKMYDLAAEQFHRFAEQYPNNPKAAESLYLAGLSYFNIKEHQKAKKEFLLLILQFPDAKDLDRAQFKIAECFQEMQDYSAAANAYRQVYVFYPKSSFAEQSLMMAANMFFKSKEYEKAAETLNEFLEIYPSSKQYHEGQLLLADVYIENNKYDRALIELDKIITTTETGDNNARALLKKANLSYLSNHLQKAEDDYQKLIDKYANKPSQKIKQIINEAYYYISEIYRKKGLFEKSNEFLYKISNYQSDSETLLLIADNYFSQREYANAIDFYKKAISQQDSLFLIQCYFKLGQSYLNLSDFVDAVYAYEQVMKICDTQNYENKSKLCKLSYYHISECCLGMKQPNLAIAYLKKYRTFLEKEKDLAAVDFRIAYLYETKANDRERAIRAYYDFIDNYFQNKLIDEAQFGLARCYEIKHDNPQALIEYENLINLFPASEHFEEVKKRINYLKNYHPIANEAITNLGNVIQQIAEHKLDNMALYQLGVTYFNELKDYRSSITLFNKVYKSDETESIPKDEILFYLGSSYQLLGEKEYIEQKRKSALLDSARYNFNLLIERFPESSWADDAAYHVIQIQRITIDKNDPEYFNQMRKDLTSFTYKYVTSSILDKVNFELGLLLLKKGINSPVDSLDVYNNFQNIITNFPQSPLTPEATFYKTLLVYQMKHYGLAQEQLKSFVSDYPNSHKTCEAYYILAKLSELGQDYSATIDHLQHIITKYYYSNYADSARLVIGSNLVKLKKYPEALSHFMDVYDEYVTDNEIMKGISTDFVLQEVIFNIANTLKTINQRIEAIQFFQLYLEKFPQGKYADQVLFLLGELFDTTDELDQKKAIDYFQLLEKNFSESDLLPSTLIKLGDLYFNNEMYDDARQYYLKAINYEQTEDKKAHVWAKINISLYRSGQLSSGDEKFKMFEKQFKSEKGRAAEILLEKGDYLLKSKNFDQAEKIFKKVRSDFKNFPEGIKAEFLLSKLYFTLNKDEKALEIVTDLIKKHPDAKILPDIYITLGNFYYLEAKQIENAMLAYKAAIEQPGIDDTNQKLGMHNLIKCYSDLQLWDKGIALSREYLNKFPLAEDAFEKKIQIGYFYYRLNEYDYAIQIFKKLKPEADVDNEPRIQYWIGECYFGKGQFQQAISEFLKIAYLSKPTKLLNQYRVTAQYQAAICYLKLGKLENAKQLFQTIITEHGAESVFGKPAKEKLDQIERLKTAENPDIL